MTTTTVEDQVDEVCRRIDRLHALAQVGAAAERSRIKRHLDALRPEQASVAVAARRAPDEFEEKLGRLKTRLVVAERSVAVTAARDELEQKAAELSTKLK